MARVKRDARAQMNDLAKSMGFDDWQQASDTLSLLRQQASGQPPAGGAPQPATPAGPSAADRLQMAINVGKAKNLPVAIVELLKGDTEDAMTTHADQLVALFGQGQQRAPGIPPAPQNGQPVTFTLAQLRDPKFVREHEAEIRRAHAEGRIVRS